MSSTTPVQAYILYNQEQSQPSLTPVQAYILYNQVQATPHFAIADHTGSVTAQPGATVTLWASVTNDGSASGTATVELYDPNNNIVGSQDVTLDPGASQTVQFDVTVPSTDGQYTYTWKVKNQATGEYDATAQDTVTVQSTAQEPHFTISDLSPSTVTVGPGEQFTVTVTVANDGSADGTVEIRMYDNQGNIQDSQQVDVTASGSAQVTLTGTAPDSRGTYLYTVKAYNVATSTVDDTEPFNVQVVAPVFDITGVVAEPSTVQPGAQFTVTVTVKNTGDASGTVEVRLKDQGGTIVDSKQASLSAGATADVQLSAMAPSQTGSYTYTVEAYNTNTGSVDDTATVEITVQPPPPPPKKGISPLWLVAGILGAIILLGSREK